MNLLRMRGDYKAATDHCRSILRMFPNNVSANQLLGDLTLESGDLPQAKEWYELALDIAPNHSQIQKKLADVKKRLDDSETAGMVEKLGLPSETSKSPWIPAGLAAAVIAVGAVAYVIGTKRPEKPAPAPQISSISAPQANPDQVAPTEPTGTEAGPAQPPMQGTGEESALAQQIASRSQNGSRLVAVAIDPRTLQLTITYRVEANSDSRAIGVELAGVALDNHATSRLVTLRAVESGNLKYVADVKRDAYEESKTDAWKEAHASDPEALAKHLLTNEWPVAAPATPDASVSSPAADPSTSNAGP